jgi:coenzyme F420-reducing hydrogenase beta subunit
MLMDSNAAKYYAAIIKNKVLLSKSSSGGVFGALAEYVLSLGGAVCGCVYNEQMEVVHIISESQNDVKKMYGSKYVQSRIGDCYEQIKKRLLTGQVVLFTGTACQVAAVRSYLGHNYDNFFTVDVLCHGVPSPGLFRMFVEHLSKKNHNRVIDIRFRDKSKNGWGSEQRTSVSYENGKKRWLFMPAYFSAFFYGMSLRESCYVCSFAGKDRVSDITIGDYWGSWKKYKKRFSEGISVISVNTDKGLNLFNLIKDDFSFCDELTQHEAFWSNNNFVNPVKKPKKERSFIWACQSIHRLF